MDKSTVNFYQRMAKAIVSEFGSGCEVVLYDMESDGNAFKIKFIENGTVSGRKVGDGPASALQDALNDKGVFSEDKLAYMTQTSDGKILKSSMVFIRDINGKIEAAFEISYDVSLLMTLHNAIQSFIGKNEKKEEPASVRSLNVKDVLHELMEQSLRSVGKPVSMMNKEDKMAVIKYLNDAGAFLITKSGPAICKSLGISKYTLYSYLEELKIRSRHSKHHKD